MSNRLVIIGKLLGLCYLGYFVESQGQADVAEDCDAGPLFEQFSLTLDVGKRMEAMGPLFYRQEAESSCTLAMPPIFSHSSDTSTDSEEFDFIYPLLTYDRFGSEYRWQFLQLLSLSGGQNQQEITRNRFTLFPVYFQQRSPDSSQNYTALFPLYGDLKQRFLRDEIFFVLFPLYSQTRKRDVVTDNYLYPLFHLRHGDALHGWQFWPLVGNEHKDVTTRTNGFGDTEIIGGYDKFFALWPIYFNNSLGIGTENPQKELFVLPLYCSLRSPKRDSTSVIWPLFTWIDDRGKKYREWQVPWPIVVVARGEGKTTTRFLPFFSRASNTNLASNSYLWPIYKYNRIQSSPLDRERTRILFFLFSDVKEKNTKTGAVRKRTDFWPFFTHRQDFNGNTRLQLLAPVEPILANNENVERNWSPLWSVWRAEKNAKTGDASQSLLWNLYRHETSGSVKKCSFLFGLFRYQSTGQAKQFRILYIPIGKTRI